jgi:MFS family permease
VPVEKRAEVFALLHTALNMGSAFGPVIGLLLFTWKPSLIFLVCSLSLFVYAALVGWKVPETLMARSKVQQAAFLKKPKVKWSEHKTLLWMTLLTMPATLLYAQVETTFPLHLQHNFENYKSVFATIITFNGCMVIALQLWIAKRTEDKPAYRMIGIAYLLFAIVALGYGYMPYLALLLIVEFLFTIGEMLYGPHSQKVISVIAPEDQRGWYFSVYGMNWQLARAIGPVVGGFLLSRFSGEFMFTVLAAVILIAGIAQTLLIKSLNPHKEKAATEEHVVA